MRVLMLTMKYHAAAAGPYLSNELASDLASLGHWVQVISLEWEPLAHVERWTEGSGVEVLRIPSLPPGGTAARLNKWARSSVRALRSLPSDLRVAEYDLLFVFAPVTPLLALSNWARARSHRSFLYITDFFPFHQHSLGLIEPWPVFALARSVERRLVRGFDAIGCMSPAGVDYCRQHYPLRPEQRLAVMPPWCAEFAPPQVDRNVERSNRNLPVDTPILLFGGQIVEGRGIETIIEAARLAHDSGLDLLFVLIGKGRLTPLVEQEIAAGTTTLRLLPPEPRESYLRLAAACDIALVVTVPDVDVPTFPSKSADYLKAGLPVLAAVEASTDFGDLIESWKVGAAIPAGDPAGLLDSAMTMLDDPQGLLAMRTAGPRVARDHLSVRAAATAMAHAVGVEIERT